jgi:Cu-processing system permease protein
MLKATLAIALATFKSISRSKLSVVVLLFSLGLFIVISLMTASSLNEEERLLKDLGLFLGSSIATLSTLALCAQTLYRDLERKSLFTIATKPISRPVIVWGKFLGVTLTSAILVMFFALIWSLLAWRLNVPIELVMLKAWVLVWLESVMIGSIAMLFGSFSTPLVTSILSFGILLIGRFAEDILRLQLRTVKIEEPNMVLDMAVAVLNIMPPLDLYNVTEEVVYRSPIPWSYVVKASVSSFTYSALCIIIAGVLFSRRDLT